MKSPRKIIVEIATSADGYIGRHNGDIEWLNSRARLDYGMMKFYATIDTILWGRKTYDWAVAYQKKSGSQQPIFDKNVANYIFSRKPPKKHPPEVKFVSEPLKTFAKKLRAKPGKHIWMMGGGELIASFLDAGEIDEFNIKVIPVFIGKGIPLIAPRHRDIPLQLLSSKKFPDGVVQLHYKVANRAGSK
ncbi:MAG TPA: dihydrofolate reductase family protein [Candidatus Sulfotelmatobacter sp.]|jgi:dihydrofolate reductase